MDENKQTNTQTKYTDKYTHPLFHRLHCINYIDNEIKYVCQQNKIKQLKLWIYYKKMQASKLTKCKKIHKIYRSKL